MMTERQRRKSRIPKFKSLEEEAEFWDTHDSTEFEDEFKEVKIEFAHPLVHLIQVELGLDTIFRLGKLGRARGVDFTALAAQWIEERLRQEEAGTEPVRKSHRKVDDKPAETQRLEG